ncbi:Arm DNA-binding domain-containing protein [Sphingomonas sp.]|uniref:Arm DNA-binding domain-containing protein n=1 Tax=Sphingomonas sp. TaxID=28214 RepID=UPI00345CF8FD
MLTTLSIRALKPQTKPYKVSDSKGLFLLVQPSGAKLWRFSFRHRGIERSFLWAAFQRCRFRKHERSVTKR